MRRSPVFAPLGRDLQRGASGLLVAMSLAAVTLLVVQNMQTDTDNSILFTHKLKSLGEIRRANQNALETVSQMLNAGGLTIPLPGNRSYSNSKTANRESQDGGSLITNWALTKDAGAKSIAIDKSSGGKALIIQTCAGNKIAPDNFASIYSSLTGNLDCSKKVNTVVEIKEVTIATYAPGFFTMDLKEANEARSRGHYYAKVGDGYEVYGLVRRNYRVESRTKFDKGVFSIGALGADMTAQNEVVDQAILSSVSDVNAHSCRWNNPNWQEKIQFNPPLADGGWGPPMYAFVSKNRSHAGDANVVATGAIDMHSGISTNGATCPYSPDPNAKDIKGWVGGVHQKLAETKGWGANVCGYGTMFYVVNPDQVDCSVSLVPLRWEGNYVGGCFATGTPIRMADGSERAVEQLKEGDQVLNPVTGKAQTIASTRRGYESKGLIEVGYDGRSIKVTENHPFITKGESLRQARSLNLGDEILGPDGKLHKITTLQQTEPEPFQWVHNLTLRAASGDVAQHAVMANGLVTGDHFLQTELERRLFAETSTAAKGTARKAPSLSLALPGIAE